MFSQNALFVKSKIRWQFEKAKHLCFTRNWTSSLDLVYYCLYQKKKSLFPQPRGMDELFVMLVSWGRMGQSFGAGWDIDMKVSHPTLSFIMHSFVELSPAAQQF